MKLYRFQKRIQTSGTFYEVKARFATEKLEISLPPKLAIALTAICRALRERVLT